MTFEHATGTYNTTLDFFSTFIILGMRSTYDSIALSTHYIVRKFVHILFIQTFINIISYEYIFIVHIRSFNSIYILFIYFCKNLFGKTSDGLCVINTERMCTTDKK